MTKRLLTAVFAIGLSAILAATPLVTLEASQDAAASAPAPQTPSLGPTPATSPRQVGNIQLDLTITDTHGGKAVRKAVSMLLGAGARSVLRSSGQVPVAWPDGSTQFQPVSLNLDANAHLRNDQLIWVTATFEFNTADPAGGTASGSSSPGSSQLSSQLTQRIDVTVRNGRPLIVSRSADPFSDRTVTVELTATIREP